MSSIRASSVNKNRTYTEKYVEKKFHNCLYYNVLNDDLGLELDRRYLINLYTLYPMHSRQTWPNPSTMIQPQAADY